MGKYAVIVGINYIKNPKAALKGCCNDARIMKGIVESKGFEEENIRLIVDDDEDCPDPSGAEVKKALEWLTTDRTEDDVIFFHFSGHGTQIPCDGDDVEEDDKDEAIVLEQMFLMADDDLKMFFCRLPVGCKVTCCTDCCHSGSMLDGEEVSIEGAKDEDSAHSSGTSDGLLSILGGSRDVDVDIDIEDISTSRSLPIDTIASILSNNLGKDVPPTGNGVNGALSQMFGGDAGKLMVKFALSQLSGGGNGKSSGTSALASLAQSFLGGGSSAAGNERDNGTSNGGGGKKKLISGLIGGFLGGFGKPERPPQQEQPQKPDNPMAQLLSGGDPISSLAAMLGGMGLAGEQSVTSSGAPAYKPPSSSTKDVAVLITGCQAHETSADVRPPNGMAFGALTKTLSDVYTENPDISHYELVSKVRQKLSRAKFAQNPCLECSEENAHRRFIC